VSGGQEAPVLDKPEAGYWGYWALSERGIYFVDNKSRAIRFFDFHARQSKHIASPEKPPLLGAPGLALSPDGNSLLYVQVDRDTADIMLVENFR
jgi:hypothetical protein